MEEHDSNHPAELRISSPVDPSTLKSERQADSSADQRAMGSDEPLARHQLHKPRKRMVRDFDWISYQVSAQEINYLRDFALRHKADRLVRRELGLDELEKESTSKTAASEGLGKRKSASGSANKENPGFPSSGIGKKKMIDVVTSMEQRLTRFGMLSEETSVIKRKMHNNCDYYEQDDFIHDPDDPQLPNAMEIVSSKFEDYFVLRGGIDALKKHPKYTERQGLMKRRNRENKITRNIEQRKKREEMQIHSLKIKIDAAPPPDPCQE